MVTIDPNRVENAYPTIQPDQMESGLPTLLAVISERLPSGRQSKICIHPHTARMLKLLRPSLVAPATSTADSSLEGYLWGCPLHSDPNFESFGDVRLILEDDQEDRFRVNAFQQPE